MSRLVRWWAALLLALAAACAWAQDVLPVPPLAGRVVDETATLNAAQSAALDAKLAAIEQKHGSQLVVLIVATTAPEDIAAYAQRVGEQWKIGRREVGDGLLVVVAKDDRKIRIEVAKALEGAVPDLAARQVITNVITPAFRSGDYAGGLNAGIDALAARIAGEGLPEPEAQGAPGTGLLQGFNLQDLAIFLFIAVPILATVARGVFGRKGGALATGGAVGAVAFWITTSLVVAGIAGVIALVVAALGGLGGGSSGARRGGHGGGIGWGGGGGGGGFSSGGGGDLGGGGASGEW
jgi:uncharacterized protein